MSNAPFPAVDGNALGDTVSVDIDKALIPYVLGAVAELDDPQLFYGDSEDIEKTLAAIENLLFTLLSAS